MTTSTGDRLEAYPRSWIDSANDPAQGFPLTSLPFCAFLAADGTARIGVGIGDEVLNLRAAVEGGFLVPHDGTLQRACASSTLNILMACGRGSWSALRRELKTLLSEHVDADLQQSLRALLCPANELHFTLPVHVTDYTDFYASRDHAVNVGKLFRPNQPLLPSYDWVPIGYHGRASSIIISGRDVLRPHGQQLRSGDAAPVFEPTQQLDYEAELAAYVGVENRLGVPVPITNAEDHIFGYSLLNDWSARDIQSWEYQPLGPFLGKSFATSVSPWVIPSASLEPYRVSARERAQGVPKPLAYLAEAEGSHTALDIQLEVWLQTEQMICEGDAPVRMSSANAKDLHWSFAQMLSHHTSNGCNLQIGDLLGSGTVSGSAPRSEGCLLERTKRGAEPLSLPNGETRAFLQDGDEVILRGYCEREGLPRISFGDCRGKVLPAL